MSTKINGNGNLTVEDNRITGDFSNDTIANRVMFQTSTVNGATGIFSIPNGTGNTSAVGVFNASGPTNAAYGSISTNGSTDFRVTSGITGTGAYLPTTFYTGGLERMRIDTSGNVGIGTSPAYKLDLVETGAGAKSLFRFGQAGVTNGLYGITDGTNFVAYSSGSFYVSSPTGTLGYGTGAGGTVTQATSKSTSVTLNKPTGQITMNNAALAAGASVRFTLNNSVIGVNDVVVVNGQAFGDGYRIELTSIGTQSAYIRVTNVTAGSLSDALIINFAIIKGATA